MKVKLSDAFELQMGKTPPRNDRECWGEGHKWISISDIGSTGKYIDATKEEITDAGVCLNFSISISKNWKRKRLET